MKMVLGFLLIVSSCSRAGNQDEDYVLIEFASRLEEDYEKISSQSLKKPNTHDQYKPGQTFDHSPKER